MSKRTILFLSIATLVLGFVGTVLFFIGGATAAASLGGATTVSNPSDVPAGASALVLIGLLVLGLAGLLNIVVWIGGMIKTAQIQAWGWFVAILLLTSLGGLIYGLAGPETRQMA